LEGRELKPSCHVLSPDSSVLHNGKQHYGGLFLRWHFSAAGIKNKRQGPHFPAPALFMCAAASFQAAHYRNIIAIIQTANE
jgi:hypothetical protein